MKKFYLILAALAALTMTAQAQNYATINVGDLDKATTYNGSFFDMAPTNFYVAHTGVQMLYTPDLLADMNGKQNVLIKSLDFWFDCQTYEEVFRNVKIYLQETDATEFAINEDGVKQFFEFGDPVKEMEINIDFLAYFGEVVDLNFDFEPFAFTPGKSLLVTMVFDADDDDNCTMGSDYAPFFTSGIRGKGMTYTNNWTSFVDFAQGEDFPDATVMLGCGTNVELPVTTIGYNYEDAPEPGDDHMQGFWLVAMGADGEPIWYEMAQGANGDYTTTLSLDYDKFGYVYYDATTPAVRHNVDYYIVINGVRYGAAEDEVATVLGTALDNPLYDTEGYYTLPVGYNYNMGVAISPDGAQYYVYAAQAGFTSVDELNAGKTVAAVRYFNVMGQEMSQPQGMTIQVTTYTDGTTSSVKVVK